MELVEYRGEVVGIGYCYVGSSLTSHADPHIRRRHHALFSVCTFLYINASSTAGKLNTLTKIALPGTIHSNQKDTGSLV